MDWQFLFGISILNTNCGVFDMRICRCKIDKTVVTPVYFLMIYSKCGYIDPRVPQIQQKNFGRRSLRIVYSSSIWSRINCSSSSVEKCFGSSLCSSFAFLIASFIVSRYEFNVFNKFNRDSSNISLA